MAERSKTMVLKTSLAEQVEMFQDYKRQCDKGEPIDGHPVVELTKECASWVVYRFDCPDIYGDLLNEALISLWKEADYKAQSKQEGRQGASLRTYIINVLVRKVPRINAPLIPEPRRPRKRNAEQEKGEQEAEPTKLTYLMLDDGSGLELHIPDQAYHNLDQKVLRKMASDKFFAEQVKKLPELQRTIVEIVLSHEQYLGERELAKEVAKRLRLKKVSRHKINVALTQLAVVVNAWLWPV